MQDTIGIDVSKASLDAFRLSNGERRQFANDRSGCAALLRWLGREAPRVVFEPTGAYHRLLEQTLSRAGIAVVKVNPRHARRFAEATGALAKTDQIDAALLARMAPALALEAAPARSESRNDLSELAAARRGLVKDRAAALTRAQTARNALLRRQLKARLRQVERQVAEIDAAMAALVAKDETLARRREILVSIPGVGAITATTILIEMPELGALDGKEAASLAGLAPMTRESGGWKGRARIRGGRAALRCGLYMPALVAMRFNPDLRRKYEALKAAGKPTKVALVAIMRKLIVLANALIRQDREWRPNAA